MAEKKSTYHKQIGLRIRGIRKHLGMNQVDFSAKFNVSSGMLSDYENGKHPQPIHLLIDISRETDFNLVWLCTGEGSKTYKEAITKAVRQSLQISDEKSTYKTLDDRLLEIVQHLEQDEDLLQTVWHLVKAKQGLKQL